MAIFRCIRLAFLVAIIAGCSVAQDDGHDTHVKRNWLLCDIDWIFTPYEVGREFSIKLSFRQAPLSDIRVILTPSAEGKDENRHIGGPISAVTDSSGAAHFSAVPSGKYRVGARGGIMFPSNELTVHSTGGEEEVAIEWPLDPLAVRTLRGKLVTVGDRDDADGPLLSATVQLVELRSSKVLETQRTTEDGSYTFSWIKPGLYAIRVIPQPKDKNKRLSADLSVELDPTARESIIPELKVEQSECAGVQLSP